jgi:hypothetical protein
MKIILSLVVMLLIGSRAMAAQPTIELRGVLVGVGPTKLSFVDKTNDTTRWVEIGQTFAGYKVTAYDTATESATLTKDGTELRLRLNAATVKDAAADSAFSPAASPPAEVTRAVLNNLRQISAAADQYYLETGRNSVTLVELVGPEKYIKQLKPVDGESYEGLELKLGSGVLKVTTTHGVSVSYAP